jgi:hypothetical protein
VFIRAASTVARPIQNREGPAEPGEAFSPSALAACRQNPAGRRPMVGGGVAGEQVGRVADRIGSRREGRGSPKGFSPVEVLGGGQRMVASWSWGHRRGLSGWGGSTWWRDAWGGVEMVVGGLEWAVRGSSVTASTTVFRVAQER